MSILIQRVSLEGETVDIYIEGNRIVRIGEALSSHMTMIAVILFSQELFLRA